MKFQSSTDDSLLVDISDALSERDRVRFTVHTRTKLPQFSKPNLSVVRQHEEFIWLHDCLVENDQYAGYIIPPPPPKPDFDTSREKLQRLGDSEANLTKDEFAKMKQELEAEYLAIFKKTVALHEMFLQRLAAHEKFREDSNFKIFLEYENELAVRGKSTREKWAGSIQNIGKSLTDFVITTSQVASSNSISNITGLNNNSHSSTASSNNLIINNNNNNVAASLDNRASSDITSNNSKATSDNTADQTEGTAVVSSSNGNGDLPSASTTSNTTPAHSSCNNGATTTITTTNATSSAVDRDAQEAQGEDEGADEQYFEKERLFLALYYNSIRDTATFAEKVTLAHKCIAEDYLQIAQQLVRLGSIEIVPNSEKLKQVLLYCSDYFENAKKVEARVASDEDLKLTDTFLYYKNETAAAQDLLTRRLRFMSEFENATKNLERARMKGNRTALQYAEVIQKQAKENFISISRLAKKELIDYKQRRVASFKKAFSDLAELEIKHLRMHSQLVMNCLNICHGVTSATTTPTATATSNNEQ